MCIRDSDLTYIHFKLRALEPAGEPSLIELPGFADHLRVGENLLAIHALNFSTTSSDFFIRAALVERTIEIGLPEGSVFFTTDGSDPSAEGAQDYSEPFSLDETVLLKARTRENGEWSPLSEALFVVEGGFTLRITELMYHPSEAVAGLGEAIDRVEAAHALGANACFVEAPGSRDQLAEIGRRTPGPRVANMIEGGKTPLLSREVLGEMGFQLILYPLTGLFGAARAMRDLCARLMADGTSAGVEDQLMDFGSFNELIGVEERLELVRRLQQG